MTSAISAEEIETMFAPVARVATPAVDRFDSGIEAGPSNGGRVAGIEAIIAEEIVDTPAFSAEEVEGMLAGPPRAATPVADGARAALQPFQVDGARVRTAAIDEHVVLYIITSKPATGCTGPTINAGLEPYKTVQEASDVAVVEGGRRVVVEEATETSIHTAWAFGVGPGRLVRTWRRGPTANEDERFFAITRTGVVKPLDRLTYGMLRRALSAQRAIIPGGSNSHATVTE